MIRPCRALLLAAAVATAIAVLPAPPDARADQDDPDLREARKHFSRGEKLFALGRFAEALEAYEAAFEAKPLPDFLFNVGQCHRNLGNYDQAIFSYRKYLKLDPDAHNRAAVEKLIAELERERKRQRDKQRNDELVPDPDPVKDEPDGGLSPWWYVGGSVAVVAVTVGAVVLLSDDGGPSIPDSDLGNLDFGK